MAPLRKLRIENGELRMAGDPTTALNMYGGPSVAASAVSQEPWSLAGSLTISGIIQQIGRANFTGLRFIPAQPRTSYQAGPERVVYTHEKTCTSLRRLIYNLQSTICNLQFAREASMRSVHIRAPL